ncbi:TPA: hypothetical protein I7730_16030 [Vibrio vulnificus]|uniref:Uncharacterized protein n=1 Tax=Vibrio vulnificus TaxID=672 RepID=A0A8H9N1X2_VIBVL|nr:hypothetical protein [Vibrio vulnificus]
MIAKLKLNLSTFVKSVIQMGNIVALDPKTSAPKIIKLFAHCMVLAFAGFTLSKQTIEHIDSGIASYIALTAISFVFINSIRISIERASERLTPYVMYTRAKNTKLRKLTVERNNALNVTVFRVGVDDKELLELLRVEGSHSEYAFYFFTSQKNVKHGQDIIWNTKEGLSTIEMSFT